jgi:hypothetical protein
MNNQEAIKILKMNRYEMGLPNQGSTWKPNADTIACDLAITALEAQKDDAWFPVTERLPTDCQRLIVYNKSGNLYLSRFMNNEFIDIEYNAFNDHQENTIDDVVKWKPITTYYK